MSPSFHFLPPSPRLAGLVRQHQLIRLRFAAGEPVPPKPYWPRPAAALAFYLRDREWVRSPLRPELLAKPRAVLIGQPTSVTWRQGGANFSVYQIEFAPGALHRLTGLSLAELTDDAVDAEAIFPSAFRRLIDCLEDSQDPAAMIALAESFLIDQLARRRQSRTIADDVAQTLILRPGVTVERLASRHDLGARQLRRAFADRVGVSPKLFARVARFDRLIRLHNRSPQEDWLSLAVHAGYYDDHHVRRDFRTFALSTPTAFSAAEGQAPERRFGFKEL